MATRTDAYPDVAIPPGEYLAEEIEARGITQKELARRMGRPANAINEIIKGKKAITAETALQLEEVMPEIPARFWLNLETDYALTRAIIKRQAGDKTV
jgi:HTH-type transcriptional regulator/antitoxin HigA